MIGKEHTTPCAKQVRRSISQSLHTSRLTHFDEFIKRHVQNELFVCITLASQSTVSNEQITHGETLGFISCIALGGANFGIQIHELAVICGCCVVIASTRSRCAGKEILHFQATII